MTRRAIIILSFAVIAIAALGPAELLADAGGPRGEPSKASQGLRSLASGYEAHGRSAAADEPYRPAMPAVRVVDNRVVIDAVASGDAGTLLSALQALGLEGGATFGRVVSGQLPIAAISELEGLPSLKAARPAYVLTHGGSVTSQGDAAMRADIARSTFGVDGTGVTVGTLSDSYDCLGGAAADVASGDLPAGVSVLQEMVPCTGGTDEGRAMMQLVHDVAPGAAQIFHTAFNGRADFANGIVELAAAGADVINDDVIYLAEPMFQDGIVAQAVDYVVNTYGVPYFSSAGNNGRDSYESPYEPATSPISGYISAHDFDPGPGVDTLQRFTVPPEGELHVVLQWDQPFFSAGGAGATSDYDLFLLNEAGVVACAFCASFADNINVTGDAVEIAFYENTGAATVAIDLVVTEFDRGTPSPFGPYIKIVHFRLGPDEWLTSSPTIYGHAGALGAEAVGAAPYFLTPTFGTSPAVLEPFSSAGPVTIFFDLSGAPLPTPEVRDKPEVVGPDGTNTTFFFQGTDPEPDGFPNFFGTSAAVPHVAAVAALVLEARPLAYPKPESTEGHRWTA